MPGIIPHLIAGISLFLGGGLYLKHISKKEFRTNDRLLLFGVCILFSIIPDFPLGLYYIFNISTKQILLEYHSFLHTIITPISLIILLFLIILKFIKKTKKEPIWIMGIICILTHIIMDLYIHEGSLWI